MALLFLGLAVLMNFFSYFFSDKLAIKMSGAQPMEESENAAYFQMVAGTLPAGRHPDAAPVRDSAGTAERIRDRP